MNVYNITVSLLHVHISVGPLRHILPFDVLDRNMHSWVYSLTAGQPQTLLVMATGGVMIMIY